MKTERILIPIACIALAFSGWASAQSTARPGAPIKTPRIDIGTRVSPQANIGRATRNSSAIRGVTHGRRPSTGARVPSGRLPGGDFGRLPGQSPLGGLSGLDGNPLNGLLGQFLLNEYGYGRHFDPYEGEKALAKAHRDAAIANAIVNVVGILVTANQPVVTQACPPAQPALRGHVERQRILVQEARVEEYRVWIPEYTIPETGEVVVGHHETRRREIPAVYEDRDVWVPAP